MAKKKPPVADGKPKARSKSVELVGIPSPRPANECVPWRVELLRATERDQWLKVEKLIPADDALNRIAERFTSPREWFEEEDVL